MDYRLWTIDYRLKTIDYGLQTQTYALRIKPKSRAIMAITNNTWIRPVAEYKNTPSAHPIIRITATIYNKPLMMLKFLS